MQEILDKTAIVSLSASLWSGRRLLEAGDVGLNESEIPDVVNLGSKKVIDPDKLSPFLALKRRADRFCRLYGVKFLNGYAVPIDKLDGLTPKLDEIVEEFQKTLDEFLAEYDTSVETWKREHPALAESITRAAPSEKYLRNRMKISYQVFSIVPAEKFEAKLEEQVSGLPGQLKKEIRDAARQIWKVSVGTSKGKVISRKVLSSIRVLLDKMDGLSYLDSKIVQEVEYHREILDGMPTEGPISGRDLLRLRSSVLLLSEINLMATETEEMNVMAEIEDGDTELEVANTTVVETEDEKGTELNSNTDSVPPEVWF